MVMPRLAGRSEQARKIAAKADIESNIAMGLDMYELDNGTYPAALDDLMKKPPEANNWNGPYLKKKPKDPWSREYHYKFRGEKNPDSYDLSSNGRDGSEGRDDITNWSEKEESSGAEGVE